MTMPDVSSAHAISEKLRSALGQVVKGRDDTIKKIIAAIFADGHVLLEDYPGSGKTTLCTVLLDQLNSSLNLALGIEGNPQVFF